MEKNGIEILLSLTIYFFFQIAIDIIRNDEDPKVETMNECKHRKDWPKWKENILNNLNSLEK